MAPKTGHFQGRAKPDCFYFEGAPSQIDLFDPKPKLNELHGQKLPESFTKNVRFAFIQKDTATILAVAHLYEARRVGHGTERHAPAHRIRGGRTCLVRSMHTEAFNHHPGQLFMNTGFPLFGRPSIGSWLLYGLGAGVERTCRATWC